MNANAVNRLLWGSTLCVLWGLAGLITETVSQGTQITPQGLPGMTLLTLGLFGGAIGQVLFRQAAKIAALERRLSERGGGA